MKKWLLFWLLWNIPAWSLELGGYLETTGNSFLKNSVPRTMITEKLRLEWQREAAAPAHLRFGAALNFINYDGYRNWNLLDFVPGKLRDQVPPEQQDFFVRTPGDTIYPDLAWVAFSLGELDVTLGKKQVSPGTGYAWNPTDLFNTKDLLDPTYEQPGHNALRLDYRLGGVSNAWFLLQPEDGKRRPAFFGRWQFHLPRLDFSFCAGMKTRLHSDFNTMLFRRVEESLLGVDLAGEMLGLGVWMEGAWRRTDPGERFTEAVCGLDYTFENQLYVLGEYFYSSLPPARPGDNDLNDWLRFIIGETRSLTRHQGYLLLSYPLSDLTNGGLSLFGSLDDGSFGVVGNLQAEPWEDLEVTMMVQLYGGGDGTTFARENGAGGVLRLRYYF